MRRTTKQLETITREIAAERERERFTKRAIASRKRRKLPLDADALVQEAIHLADRGTSYLDFVRDRSLEKWREGVFKPYRAEVVRQLGVAS
jgi:hypothetical protein